MIECCDENIYYKRRRHRPKFKRWLCVLCVILIVFSFYTYYKRNVCEQIFSICADYAYSFSTESVNGAVLSSLSDSVKYNELINVEKNNNGDIVLMSANSHKINLINREIADLTSKSLKSKLNTGIPIPSLAFTGIDIIAGYGSEVYLKTISVASVTCEFNSNFSSMGINQTLHTIYVDVISDVKISVPLNEKSILCKTSVIICESVLVGKVPEIYLNGKLF